MFGSMLFPIFLGSVVLLFFLLPAKWRPAVLLFSSYIFCAYLSIAALACLLFVSATAWAAGLWISSLQTKGFIKKGRIVAAVAVSICVAMLVVFKYAGSLAGWTGMRGTKAETVLSQLVMPVGLSFYLFQVISYLVDLAGGKIQVENNFWYLGCAFAFFPKLVSGPIERVQDFLPQIKRLRGVKLLDRGRLSAAFTYLLWGYFMKMVVADRLAMQVGILFDRYQEFDSFFLVLGAFFYTVQIYCDFAGYSYIAVGCAKIFGIDLTQNFQAPYQAQSITEFWRRWHVSLSSWLRDYLYIPLGGGRKGFCRKCVNTMIVFLVCGMWHGAGLSFIIWGILHGLYSVTDNLFRKKGWKMPAGRLITFGEVAFAWIFFRAGNLGQALSYIKRMFTAGIDLGKVQGAREILGLSGMEILVIGAGILMVFLMDERCSRRRMHFPFLVQQEKNYVRYFVFYLLLISIFIFGIYGPGYHVEQFIYMQF